VTAASTGYARPMPALGFDPAPGDVGSTTALTRRYAEIAAEITAVQTQVTSIDLTRWDGKAAIAARTKQTALAQALAQAADTTTKLSEAAARWAPRLTTYQAEADALERQAAGEQANQQYLAARAPRVPQLTSDLAESATAMDAIRAQAKQLHQEYLATAAGILTQFDLSAWWDSTEDIRKYPEGVLAFFDTTTTDHWIAALERLAEVPTEWVKEFGEAVSACYLTCC
jgi:cell division protein ZapA (FtsZ GTPase activity inhibitor)